MKKNLFVTFAFCGVILAGQMSIAQGIGDAGTQAVYEAQETVRRAPSQTPGSTSLSNADQQLKQFTREKEWNTGSYDPDGERILVIETAEFDCANPATDESFLLKRDMKTKEAVLRARIKIIESINSEMNAYELLYIPDHPVREKLDREVREAEEKLESMKRRLASLKAHMDQSEAEKLAGVTWSDRSAALMNALIKKIDTKYDTGEIEAAKREAYERDKAAYLEAREEMASLEAVVDADMATLQEELTTSISQTAKMPLFGATVIAQAESWNENDQKYQVAVLVCWSNSLHRTARAIAIGEDHQAVAPGKRGGSIHDWLAKQDWAVMSGPRQFLDGDGNRWFLGISARGLPKASSRQRAARSAAELFAGQMAVFSIYADLASQTVAEQIMRTRNPGGDARDSVQAAESISEMLTQEFKNKTVRGLRQLLGETVTHPISGERMYVAVYGINPAAARQALAIERENYATAVQAERHQSREQGRREANISAREAAVNDKASFNQGKSEQAEAIGDIVKRREDEATPKQPGRVYTDTPEEKPAQDAERKPRSGTFMGDMDVADDF